MEEVEITSADGSSGHLDDYTGTVSEKVLKAEMAPIADTKRTLVPR